jgi:hypothetical protein
VTLVLTIEYSGDGTLYLNELNDEEVTFERLEILYLGRGIAFWGLSIPHARHVSLDTCSDVELEKLKRSPNLESLLIRSLSRQVGSIDLRSCPHLKLLGFREERRRDVAPLGHEHALEHVWLFGADPGQFRNYGDPRLIEDLKEQFPGSLRFTIDLSSVPWTRTVRNEELRKRKLASIELFMRPPMYEDDPIINIEYAPVAKDGILKQVWKKLRR